MHHAALIRKVLYVEVLIYICFPLAEVYPDWLQQRTLQHKIRGFQCYHLEDKAKSSSSWYTEQVFNRRKFSMSLERESGRWAEGSVTTMISVSPD